jgi:hypothetical protein
LAEHTTAESSARAVPLFFLCFAAYVLVAPLYYASVDTLPLLLLELAAIGFLFMVVVVRRTSLALPRTLVAGIAILLVYPMIQLVPLPETWWRAIPGHSEYVAALDRFAAHVIGQGTIAIRHTLSVVPSDTEAGWLALLPPLACFAAALTLRVDDLPKLMLAMAVLAGLEGLLGLLQVGAGGGSIFYFRTGETYGTAVGTFVNRNHYAALLAMSLPIVVGVLVYDVRHTRHHRHRWDHRPTLLENIASERGLLFACAVAILLGLIFTRSRAGTATAAAGLVCSAILLARARSSAKHSRYLVPGLVAVSLALALAIGITPVLDNLEPRALQLHAEGRMLMTETTLTAAVEFLPFGSGLSTLVDVFPRFQPPQLAGLIDYAHNDYAQAFMELGIAAPIAVALLLAAYAMRMIELLREKGSRSFSILQIAAGIGLLPMILHSLFDFGLHMPALAMWFATLAGVLFHRGAESSDAHQN